MTCTNYTSKTCHTCKIDKPLSEFYKSKRDGLHCSCKLCFKRKINAYQKTKDGVVTTIYYTQKISSKKRNHAMPDYTKSAFSNWLFSQPEFHRLYDLWVASGYLKMEKPSCDRKDDYAPYAFDNLQIITWQENDEKGKSDRKNGINNKHSKAVIQFDLSGNLITKHYSGRYAERVTGINSANISACCLGKVKSAGGFKWSHA